MAAAAPHREQRAALSSALCDSDRAEGTARFLAYELYSSFQSKTSILKDGSTSCDCIKCPFHAQIL